MTLHTRIIILYYSCCGTFIHFQGTFAQTIFTVCHGTLNWIESFILRSCNGKKELYHPHTLLYYTQSCNQIFLILQVSLSFNGKFSNAHYLMTLPRLFNVKKVLILKSESMPNISSIMKTIYRYFDTDSRTITHLFQYYN